MSRSSSTAAAALLLALAGAACAAPAGQGSGLGPRGMNCSAPAPRAAPANVSDLRPGDVRLVGAIGDSITAAFAVEGGLWEYRDRSWAVGAGAGQTTLFNYIKAFSPSVSGGSTKDHFPELHHTPHSYPTDHLNSAQSGAKVADIAKEQVTYLVEQLKAIEGSDDMWKVITLWIGANDICQACTDARNSTESAAAFEAGYEAALEMIHKQIPRVFVNLIPTMPLSALGKIVDATPRCVAEHKLLDECHCVFKGTPADWAVMDDMTRQYNQVIRNLGAKYNKLDTQSAFVVQPFLEKSLIPDISYVSTLDCFHPSAKAHADLGTILWNQMLTPVASKPTGLPASKWYQDPACPAADGVFHS